ncbi:MAG: polymer-forming cytoskeletal protein [Candidatus Cryptobacteroides sp.]
MSTKPQTPAVNVNEVSRISTGSVIKGEISSPNDIRIDGTFEGRIVCSGRVVAGEKAQIKGDIVCENVDFWGKLEGSLYVKDTLTLKDTCSVQGDLHIKRLVVELGAHFDGTCKMLTDGELDKMSGALSGQKPAKKPSAQASTPAVS